MATTRIGGVSQIIIDSIGDKEISCKAAIQTFKLVDADKFIFNDSTRSFIAPIAGIDPTAPNHLTTKAYVDSVSGSNNQPAPAPVILQVITTTVVPQAAISTTVITNAVPLISDGIQMWVQTITPKSATGRIEISGSVYVDHSNNNRRIIFAIFRNTTCIGVSVGFVVTSGKGSMLSFATVDTPGISVPVNYSIRYFDDGTGTSYIAQCPTPIFGGMLAKSSITVKEFA